MNSQGLHEKLSQLVKSERKVTDQILFCIQEIDLKKSYLKLGFSSLFDYLVKFQKYSEGAAQRRISAARLLREIPGLAEKLQTGSINLSQLAKLQVAIKQEQKSTAIPVKTSKKAAILEKMENKNSFETDRVLAQELRLPENTERIQVQRDENIFLGIKLKKAQFEKLAKVQGMLSHVKHDSNFAEVIEILCDHFLKAKLGKPTSVEFTAANTTQYASSARQNSAQTKSRGMKAGVRLQKRKSLPIKLQRRVLAKACHCCEYVSPLTEERCGSTFQLQIDHVVPLAAGGDDSLENLRVLCRSHNLLEARSWGLKFSTNEENASDKRRT
jgi:5-methylcytosine-specific restriction endonuclease McrA